MVGIYKIVSPNNEIYIGQSWDIKKRFKQHKSLQGIGYKSLLYNSFIKEGINNHIFEIIHELPFDINQQVLNDYEKIYWRQYKEAGFKMLNSQEPANSKKRTNIIYQYSLDGYFIKEWLSISEAARFLGVSSHGIQQCVSEKGKESAGYIWSKIKTPFLAERKYKDYILKLKK